MAEDRAQQLNFTVVPDDDGTVPRVYSNFCAIQNSPFDFTLSFCEMLPLGEKQVKEAQATHVVKAPVRAPIAPNRTFFSPLTIRHTEAKSSKSSLNGADLTATVCKCVSV